MKLHRVGSLIDNSTCIWNPLGNMSAARDAEEGKLKYSIPGITHISENVHKLVQYSHHATAHIRIYESYHEKTVFFVYVRKLKTQISFTVTAKLIRAFVFATLQLTKSNV